MKRSNVAIILLLILFLQQPIFAQMPLPKIQQFGIDGLRLMLQNKGLRTTQDRVGTALGLEPENTVAIILGDLRSVSRIDEQLNDFVHNGGALLVASDLRGMKVDRTPICGAWPKATRLLNSSERKRHGYRNYADCPIVTDFERNGNSVLFDGVTSIVANRPGEVECLGNVRQIAWLPSGSKPPLMVTYRNDSGRMLFVADHSIFINEMLVHGDNARFVNNVADWLCESGKRTTLVLINDGQVLPDWSFGETPPAIPLDRLVQAVRRGGFENLPIGETVIPIVNESVARYQREDGFNRDVRRFFQRMFGRRSVRNAMFLMTGLIVIRFLYWLTTRGRPRRWLSFQDRQQSSEPKSVGAVRDKHYFSYLRTLAREFFLESGAGSFQSETPPVVHSNPQIGGSNAIQDVTKLWAIAAGKHTKMSKKKFNAALQMLREVRQLQLAGDLRLEWTTPLSTRN